jgi:hypothetical protein
MLRARWEAALDFEAYVAAAENRPELWRDIHARARVAPAAAARVAALPGSWRLLVLSEDWCGDAVNTVPFLARLAEAVPNLQLRILGRDANPDLMDTHLTGTSRSIPVAIVLDEDFRERGWWGPRPTELQRWFLETGRQMPSRERYLEIRRWYAHDRGATTIDEVVGLLERAAAAPPSAGPQ